MQHEQDTVTYEVEGGIAWVWFNRPDKRNAMSRQLNRRMLAVLDELEFLGLVGLGLDLGPGIGVRFRFVGRVARLFVRLFIGLVIEALRITSRHLWRALDTSQCEVKVSRATVVRK